MGVLQSRRGAGRHAVSLGGARFPSAALVFEHISGERVGEIEETDDDGRTTIRRERRFNAAGVPFRELANSTEKTVTLRIDSKLLAEADAGGASGGRLKEAERLRELIANVGKPGTAGEQVVGRGLRRISYDVEKNAAGEERLRPEYVDIYGREPAA